MTRAWSVPPIPALDGVAAAAARRRQDQLLKPRGSLGRLEELAVRLAAMTGGSPAAAWPPAILVFAADHGVAARGVSAYPPEVTAQMVHGYLRGLAAVNVLARMHDAVLRVVDVGVASELPAHPGLVDARVRAGTRDFTQEPALDRDEVETALLAGAAAVDEVAAAGCGLVALGEMGIGNTTAAAAVVAALTGADVVDVTGRGTGLDDEGLRHKARVVAAGLRRHRPDAGDPVGVLAAVGGLEIAALAGAALQAASRRVPVVLDGFITGAAALAAVALAPACRDYLVAGHRSAESGHRGVLEALGLEPLVDLGMRLGEGSGAALGLFLLEASFRLHTEMATFGEAGVTDAGA